MRHEVLPGGERRRQWCDEEKLTIFLPVEMAAAAEVEEPVSGPGGSEVIVLLRNGRHIRCRDGIGEDVLARLIRLVETA